ncbi:hypothetical protein [Fodinicola acaciae]|uniref:hypothetical protein n=1 Tax=Fodinicola acaciae TaxID=2681555 RepID=UPI0013D33181|nr:hypothetical protein [Fodinicola acaciae]
MSLDVNESRGLLSGRREKKAQKARERAQAMLDRQKAAVTAATSPAPATMPATTTIPATDLWPLSDPEPSSMSTSTDTSFSDTASEWSTELNWTPISWDSPSTSPSTSPVRPATPAAAPVGRTVPEPPAEQPVVLAPVKPSRWDWLRSAGPILIVNGVSAWGQASYAHDHLVPESSPFWIRWTVGAIAALAAESVALYVNWHAHDALIRKDNRTAGRLRRSAYAIAAIVASVNYIQFSDHGTPTPLAVVIAMFTILSPWLWGLHTRRRQHMQLTAEGVRSDGSGAVFSAIRRFYFPITTIKATRWSVDHGVTDPRAAWEGYRAYRLRLDEEKAARAENPRPAPVVDVEEAEEIPEEPAVEAVAPPQPAPRPGPRPRRASSWPRIKRVVRTRVRTEKRRQRSNQYANAL